MFALPVLALALAASTSALVIPRGVPPPTYAVGYLEDYTTYHIRYLALKCQDHKGDDFFNACCHPMLATENLKDNRKPYCTPSKSASSVAAVAEPTSTIVPSGDDDCSDDADESSAADPAPTPDNAPKNVAADPSSSSSSSTSSPSSNPKPTSTEPTTTSTPPPKPSPTPDHSSGGSGGSGGGGLGGIAGPTFQGGIATFFFQNGVPGNCGTVHQDSDFIVALQSDTYAGGAHCGKTIVIKNANTGKTQEAVVADSCPTCNNPQSIDLSKDLFASLADPSAGTFPVEWGFK